MWCEGGCRSAQLKCRWAGWNAEVSIYRWHSQSSSSSNFRSQISGLTLNNSALFWTMKKRLWVLRQPLCLFLDFASPSHQERHIVCSTENTLALLDDGAWKGNHLPLFFPRLRGKFHCLASTITHGQSTSELIDAGCPPAAYHNTCFKLWWLSVQSSYPFKCHHPTTPGWLARFLRLVPLGYVYPPPPTRRCYLLQAIVLDILETYENFQPHFTIA